MVKRRPNNCHLEMRDDQLSFTFLIQNKMVKRRPNICHLEVVMIQRWSIKFYFSNMK